jgi:hypothetical protein
MPSSTGGRTSVLRRSRAETDKLAKLIESNTDLTRWDKDLTEKVADLTKQIHAILTSRS